MTSDDREKIGARNRPDLKTARQLHLSDLLRGPFDIKSVALSGLFILAVFYTMYFMRAMLLPLVLALLLSYLLAPVVRLLGRLRVNAPLGAAIVLLSLVGLLIYGASRLAEPVAGWLEKAPYSLRQLQQKIVPLKRPMEKVAQASGEIEKLTTSTEPQAQPVVVKRNALAEAFLSQTPDFIASGVVMFILLNFVPYLGALTGIICMTLGAALSFDSLGYAMVFPASYLVLATLEGNFITPMVLGRSLTLNPVVILIALIFWGWMWGISGMILAVPILATLKIFCDHLEPMAPIGEFMS